MVQFKCWTFFVIVYSVLKDTSASTHWIVTEEGRIQSKLDSPFHLRRPYDLLAFLEQDNRKNKIDILYQQLVSRKFDIDEQWSGIEGAKDLESRLYQTDEDCLRAGTPLSEFDLYRVSSDGLDERNEVNILEDWNDLVEEDTDDDLSVPDCNDISPLDFSMFSFEHLHAMNTRTNVSIAPEQLNKQLHSSIFGHMVAKKLSKNSTSWLLYDLSALYWRQLGNAPNSIECSRRAIHFAPRTYRDVSLANLGYILHKSRHPGDAAIVFHAAIDHYPKKPTYHLALGNVYAILADYNRSVGFYDNCIKLSDDNVKYKETREKAILLKHSVLCHKKLVIGLKELHESLQGILSELQDYHDQQEQWLQLQERLAWEQIPLEARLVHHHPDALSALLADRGQTCTARSGVNEQSAVLSCDVNTDSQVLAQNLHLDITLSLQMLLRNVETQANKISVQMGGLRSAVKEVFTIQREKIIRKHTFHEIDDDDIKLNEQYRFS